MTRVYDEPAMRFTDFRGPAKRLEDLDLPRIGHRIGVGEDELHAFMEVEASGSGFDKLGRPKMLFEPHVFFRNLPQAKRAGAVAKGLAYPKWRPGSYPKDSYPLLIAAMAIDETAALKAPSWGLGQVLGENHHLAGFDTVQDMVQAFTEDEEHHLEAMVKFLISAGLDDDLREHRWEALARGYNGPKYAVHNYHGRLKQAFAKWSKIKDTPWSPGMASESDVAGPRQPAPRTWSDAGLAKWEIEGVQKRLRELGYFEVGKVDGIWGSRTTAAISAFQHDNGLRTDGRYGADTKAALAAGRRRPIAPERARTTADDLRNQGSSTVARADNGTWGAKVLGWASALVSLAIFIMNNWAAAETLIAPFRPLLGWVPVWAYPLPVLAAALYLYVQSQGVIAARVQSERSGMHNGEPDPAPSPPSEHAPEPAQGLPNVFGRNGQLVGFPFPIPGLTFGR